MSRFAVLGSPISHSKSPIIHAAAYRVLGESWHYDRFEVAKGGLKRFVESDANECSGFSVTMPLKEEAFNFAQETDELSKLTRASNTLVKVDNRWLGYNTDIFGITQAVRSKIITPPTQTLIIGSGSTATSAVVAISKIAPGSKIQIFARNSKARSELIQFAVSLGLQASRCLFLSKGIAQAALTVATLPGSVLDSVSEKLSKRKSLVPGGLLLDVAYHPWPSKFAAYWMANDRPVVSGLEMLIWQAVAQIRIFRNGSPEMPLQNEIAVVESMRLAASE
jgi:shikimate dehydrogenase